MAMSSCDTESNLENPDLNYFIKYYGGDGDQYGVDMLVLSDGNFVLLGNYQESAFDSDLYLIRVTAEGEMVWELRIGQEDNSAVWTARDIELTSNGDFIVLADYKTGSGDASQTDLRLVRISASGEVLKMTDPFGTIANDFGRTVTPVDDGSFVVSGMTALTDDFGNPNVTNPDVGNFLNYRFDANLDMFTSNDWGPVISGFGGRLDVAVKAFPIFLQPDPLNPPVRYFYIFGYSKNVLFNEERMGLFYFLRGDTGSESSNLNPGGHSYDTEISFVLAAAPELGSGFVAVGTTTDNVGNSSIFAGRLRNTLTFASRQQDAPSFYGSLPIGKNVRGVSAASSVVGEQGYLILGNEVRITGTNIWLSKIDQTGAVIWSASLGSEGENDTGAAVAELPDGRIAVLGTAGLADNQFKMTLIKMNRTGQFLR